MMWCLCDNSFVRGGLASVLMLSAAWGMSAKKADNDHGIFLTSSISANKAVVGEMIAYDITLHTPTPDIVGVSMIAEPDFAGLTIFPIAPDNHLSEETIADTSYYSVVVARYYLSPSKDGSYKIVAPKFAVGMAENVIVNDPFWGSAMQQNVEEVRLSADDQKLKVSPLPLKNRPDDFSGAVGSDLNFDVEVPKGEIIAGDDAVVIFTIYGEGNLQDVALPDFRTAFGDSLRFKSESPSHSHFIKDGQLHSEIEIECVFTPSSEGEFQLSEVPFCFFNKATRQYEAVKSPPITLKVVKSASPQGTTDLIFEEV